MTPPSATNTAETAGSERDRGLAVLALSKGGCALGARLAQALNGDFFACKGRLAQVMAQVWRSHREVVCIMATGIVIRTLAPLLEDKYRDPAVVVCDERGQFAISLLSGHLGGANVLAREVAAVCGGQAVLTTASDVLGRTALDLWCRDLGLVPADKTALTRAMGRLVDQGLVRLWSRYPLPELPPDLVATTEPALADLVIDSRTAPAAGSDRTEKAALLLPKALVVGIGCNRGTPASALVAAVEATCEQRGLALGAIARLASIDLKNDEQGLLDCARHLGLPLDFHTKERLNQVAGVATSAAALRATGAKAVAEPAALLSAGPDATLLVAKIKWTDATTAVAEIADPLAQTSGKQQTP